MARRALAAIDARTLLSRNSTAAPAPGRHGVFAHNMADGLPETWCCPHHGRMDTGSVLSEAVDDDSAGEGQLLLLLVCYTTYLHHMRLRKRGCGAPNVAPCIFVAK